jgi:hypothetical protein
MPTTPLSILPLSAESLLTWWSDIKAADAKRKDWERP